LLVLGSAGCDGSDDIKDAKDIKIAPVVTSKGKKDPAALSIENDVSLPQASGQK
jgi:hypothetical protein